MKRFRAGLGTAVLATALGLASCSAPEPAQEKQALVVVRDDAGLAAAGAEVADGGVIYLEPGTYSETLETAANDVTIRGADRNTVVLDGKLSKANGIVATGERPAVENLTVRNFMQNGVLITGITDENGAGIARGPDGYVSSDVPEPKPGYLVRYVTAQNNGLYGIYAFNRRGGAIEHNLATGGSDSGIYIGQCAECAAVVRNNVVTLNAVGLEFANASGVIVTGNRIVENRIGVSVLSNYLEANGPTKGLKLVGNVVSSNNEHQTPEQASGAFGVGIGLGGTTDAVVERNRIEDNANVGVWVTSSEDFAPTGNSVKGDTWTGNGTDVVYAPDAAHAGKDNCFAVGKASVLPAGLATASCTGALTPAKYTQPPAPAGIAFSEVALTAERPGLKDVTQEPSQVPDAVDLPSLAGVTVPAASLLESGS